MKSSPRKVTLIASNLSSNGMGRVILLAEALSRRFEVQIVGTWWGDGTWPPVARSDWQITGVPGDSWPGYLSGIARLLTAIDGDVIIACKVRLPSLGVALLKRLTARTPVILDIDDDELAMTEAGASSPIVARLRHPNAYIMTRLVHRLWRFADGIFCVSEHFRRLYGGVIVPHARDAAAFQPATVDRDAIRRELGLTPGEVAVGFIGTPHEEKGVEDIFAAAHLLGDPAIRPMIVGIGPEGAYIAALSEKYSQRPILIPIQPREKVPYFLAACDVIALPQRRTAKTLGQMPAKLTDAMAMGKPVVASALADIPAYLDGCGLTFTPGDTRELADRLRWVKEHPAEAARLGRKAREKFERFLTLDVVIETIAAEIDRVTGASQPERGSHGYFRSRRMRQALIDDETSRRV